MIFLLISFLAGVLTVLAPCTLPILPVIVGSSAAGGSNKRAYTIIGSLIVSIVLFTLLIKVSSFFLNIPQDTWKYISGSILVLLALSYLFPRFWDSISFVNKLNISSNKALGKAHLKKNFLGDVVSGAALGPVFSTCSPTYFLILATVLPTSFFLGVIYLIAYSVGLGVVLLMISILGQRFADKLGFLANPEGGFKKFIGVMFLVVGLFIISGLDKKIETKILDSGYFDVTKIEQKLLEKNKNKSEEVVMDQNEIGIKNLGTYQEIVGASGYLNTNGNPIKISDYIGKKIIVVDFMTYSCINCQRTIPYLNDWYKKYSDKGLVIIGIHTPEFAFEKDIKNVERELGNMGINFPVVLDNNYQTWNAYKNQFWPRKYIIDLDGNIVYDHIGEGKYEETEQVIKKLLLTIPQNQNAIFGASETKYKTSINKVNSRETYLGYQRMDFNTNNIKQNCIDNWFNFILQVPTLNTFSFGGEWKIQDEKSLAKKGSRLRYSFDAAKFHLVTGAPNSAVVSITIDGKFVKNVEIKDEALYTLANFGEVYGKHTIDIEVVSGEPELYAITFG